MAQTPTRLSQFAFPRGAPGWAIGHFLAIANAWMDDYAVELLRLAPRERILEIGFGPGVAVRRMCRDAAGVRVCGVDPSEVMVRQAVRRNRSAVRRGQADLRLGSATSLPWADASFDGALALNNAHLWDPMDLALSECHRVLRPGGRLVLGFHIWNLRGPSDGRLATQEHAEAFLSESLSALGFQVGVPVRRTFPMGRASFLTGFRP